MDESAPLLQRGLDQAGFQPERNEPGVNAHKQEARRLADQGQTPLQERAVPSWDFGKISIFPPSQQGASGPLGQPLEAATRAFFEPRFGYDLSSVRVHAEEEASVAGREVRARAFTVGDQIVFSEGEYSPHTVTGRQLLAHEVTHVLQAPGSAGATIQRQSDQNGTLAVPETTIVGAADPAAYNQGYSDGAQFGGPKDENERKYTPTH